MEVFFLDVAQGTCQVILLGDRRAIVIDCGISNDRTLLHFLHRMGVDQIDRLIVSHSDSDHLGGAVGVLGDYERRIGKILFVQDHKFLNSAFWMRVSDLYRRGALTRDQLVRLEVVDGPQLIWEDSESSSRLRTYSPEAVENLLAQDAQNSNATSAVLFFEIRGQRIVFASDSKIAQWHEIHRKSGHRMQCRVLAMPHHAGFMDHSQEELDWLFDCALDVDVAVISVGTANPHGHPREDVVKTVTVRGTKVMCTQITSRCSSDLEALRPGVLRPLNFVGRSSRERDVTSGGRSRNVACAGTVRVIVAESAMIVDRLDEHQFAVNALAAAAPPGRCPLCRQSPAGRESH